MFYYLAQEQQYPGNLFAIASNIGTTIYFNVASTKHMIDRIFDHFIRVPIYIDFTSNIRYKTLVKRQVFSFFTELEYENLPHYCTYCKKIGHSLEKLKLYDRRDKNLEQTDQIHNRKFNATKKPFVQKSFIESLCKNGEVVILSKGKKIDGNL